MDMGTKSNPGAFVYVIGPKVGPQKIGIARDVADRIKHVQVGCPFELRVHFSEEMAKPLAHISERLAHARLAPHRQRGEWFNVTPEVATEALKRAIEDAGAGRVHTVPKGGLDGVEWLRRYNNLPFARWEAALAYRQLRQYCVAADYSYSSSHAVPYSYRRVIDAKAKLREIDANVVAAAGPVGLRSLIATGSKGDMPKPEEVAPLVAALHVVQKLLEGTIRA